MKRAFTPEQIEFIRNNYPEHGSAWVAERIGKKSSQVKTFTARNHILRSNFYHDWTAEELEKLANEFPHRRTDHIAAELGLAYHLVSNQAHRMKLKKTDAFLCSPACNRCDGKRGASFRFEKGHEPANKGVTMSDELREKVKHTWFPKGHEPKNTKYDGYERITKDGYREIRVRKGKFELLHRHNWEQVHGHIPESIIMRCKDGNIKNCGPDNWYLIDRASQLAANSGRDELTDKFIVDSMTHRHAELKPAFAEMPELIELKRNQIKLKRQINELTETTTDDR